MENKHSNGGGGFMNGLLLGILIGAALVFFLGTKKGKELLRTITEEGLEDFSELKEYFTEEEMDDEEMESSSEAPKEVRVVEHHVIRPAKRFFRGVKR